VQPYVLVFVPFSERGSFLCSCFNVLCPIGSVGVSSSVEVGGSFRRNFSSEFRCATRGLSWMVALFHILLILVDVALMCC
jgi:hypothetical protein